MKDKDRAKYLISGIAIKFVFLLFFVIVFITFKINLPFVEYFFCTILIIIMQGGIFSYLMKEYIIFPRAIIPYNPHSLLIISVLSYLSYTL